MGSLLLILALAFSLLIAIVALGNQQSVMVNYLFGRAEIPLIILILGSAIVGALSMGLFSLFRGIRTAFQFREERHRREELQLRVESLEKEKILLEAEVGRNARQAGKPPPEEEPDEPGESRPPVEDEPERDGK